MKKTYDQKIFQDGNKLPRVRAILLGNSNVGKTSLITRYVNKEFREVVYPTKDVM
jgi:GTPase SAR1 family protein